MYANDCVSLRFQRVTATSTRNDAGSTWSCTNCRAGWAAACASSADTSRPADIVITVRRDTTGIPPSPWHTGKLAKVCNYYFYPFALVFVTRETAAVATTKVRGVALVNKWNNDTSCCLGREKRGTRFMVFIIFKDRVRAALTIITIIIIVRMMSSRTYSKCNLPAPK